MWAIIRKKRKTSVFVGLIFILVIYFLFFRKSASTAITYVLGKVEKGTIVTSVSGSGQVIVSSQVDLKPKVSGKIVSINVKEGQKISVGTTIAEIDNVDASRAIRDAKLNLESAKIALDKIRKPVEELTISQAKDAVAKAQRDLEQAKKDRDQQGLSNDQDTETNYTNGYNAVSTAFLDVPDAIENLKRVQSSNDYGGDNHLSDYGLIIGSESKFITKFKSGYEAAYKIYNTTFADFKNTSRSSTNEIKYKLIKNTLEMTKAVSENLEDARNMLDAVKAYDYEKYTIASTVDAMRAKILTSITAINKDVSSMQAALDTIDSANQNNPINQKKKDDAVILAEETLKQKEDSLAKLKDPADELDVKSQELVIEQRQNALDDAESKYADYFVTTPFGGTVAKIPINLGDTVSSSTVVATMITNDLQAQISLNEVDAASIEVEDEAEMTFDALPDLKLSGKVYQIDVLGTLSQGVVTYNAKIVFDTDDERIKPGMSVSADIITDSKENVLILPNSAIRTWGKGNYVESLDLSLLSAKDLKMARVTLLTKPKRLNVEMGLSNDNQTEIINGLKEGDLVIVNTLSTAQAAAQAASAFRVPGSGASGSRRN